MITMMMTMMMIDDDGDDDVTATHGDVIVPGIASPLDSQLHCIGADLYEFFFFMYRQRAR
jgi:hypothetical protein